MLTKQIDNTGKLERVFRNYTFNQEAEKLFLVAEKTIPYRYHSFTFMYRIEEKVYFNVGLNPLDKENS